VWPRMIMSDCVTRCNVACLTHCGNAVKRVTSRTLETRSHDEIAPRCTISSAMSWHLRIAKKLSDEPTR